MKHISVGEPVIGYADQNGWKMPVKLFDTYCRQVVRKNQIDNEQPTCEDCMDSKTWEEIDAAADLVEGR